MNLSKSERKIEKKIYIYPIFIALLTSFLFILITFNFLEEFELKQKNIFKQNLIEKEKEIAKNQLQQVVKEINFEKE
jgi:hypothetical protein